MHSIQWTLNGYSRRIRGWFEGGTRLLFEKNRPGEKVEKQDRNQGIMVQVYGFQSTKDEDEDVHANDIHIGPDQ